ncbi:MAG: hypothetical protein R3E02_11195 [Blastomonas sp.]
MSDMSNLTGWQQRIAHELDAMSAETEDLGVKLCGNPDLARQFAEALQSIDLLAQRQKCIADILRAESFDAGLQACPVEGLVSRLS